MQDSKKNTRKRKERPLTSYFAAARAAPVVVVEKQEKSDTSSKAGSCVESTPAVSVQRSTKGRPDAASAKGGTHQEPLVEVALDNAEAKRQSSNSDSRERVSTSSGNKEPIEALHDCTNASAEEESTTAKIKAEEESTTTAKIKLEKKDTLEEKKPAAGTSTRSRSLPSSNVLHQLLGRSIHGRKFNVNESPPPSWRIPSWIDLCPGNSLTRNPGIKSLAWDEMGVLLAAYCDDRCIRIYDWDTVVAADLKGRNRRMRQVAEKKKDTECFSIEPILVFPFPFGLVSFLKWNPFNVDELAVGTSLSGDVYLYDINQVCARQQDPTGRGQLYRKLAASESSAVSDLLFVDKGDRLVVCRNDLLCCWSIVGARPSLLWKFRWKTISSIVPLCHDVIVLGSRQGHMALLNWKKMQRAAFSLEPMPTLLDDWVSYKGLEVPSSYGAMGIQHLRVENYSDFPTDGDKWGHCRLTWVTACGWALSTTLSSPTTRIGKSQIHYLAKPIRCVKIRGEPADEADKNASIYQTVKEAKRSWSYNGGIAVADSTKAALCWEKAPEVMKILPRHHDKRILEDTGPRFVAGSDTKPTLMWMRTFGSHVDSVPLSKRKGPATAVAIHPGNEWIVVGTAANGLYAINARSQVKIPKES